MTIILLFPVIILNKYFQEKIVARQHLKGRNSLSIVEKEVHYSNTKIVVGKRMEKGKHNIGV